MTICTPPKSKHARQQVLKHFAVVESPLGPFDQLKFAGLPGDDHSLTAPDPQGASDEREGEIALWATTSPLFQSARR